MGGRWIFGEWGEWRDEGGDANENGRSGVGREVG